MTIETMEPALVARNVSKSIDSEVILRPVDLELSLGECVAVLGDNGAGKTTLLRLLAGQLVPSTGSVSFAGSIVDERRQEIRRAFSSLIGVPAFYPDLTVREQLGLINATWGFAPAQSEPLIDSVLDAFDIGLLANRFPHELSSGQTQLFRLAMTFMRPFEVLFLDEPEQRLDPSRKDRLVTAIRAARDAGATVIITCHDVSVVKRVADRSVTLTGG